jgi:uncharacterized protein (TIGR02145 family)
VSGAKVFVGDPFTDARDGSAYPTVMIGRQCWLGANLRFLPAVSPMAGRSPFRLWKNVPLVSRTEPYRYVFGYQGRSVKEAKATAHYRSYGVLYNWPAALRDCPAGWHLPSDEEWTQLVDHMRREFGLSNDWGPGSGVGNALKSRRQVDSPLGGEERTNEHPRWDSVHTPAPERKTVSVNAGPHHGTDAVGFAALPGGRLAYGDFTDLGFHGFWWSSSECYATRAWHRFMRHEFGDVTRSNFDKAAGFSVRCVRD